MMRWSLALLLLLGSISVAQDAPDVSTGLGAVVRAIDTLNGDVQDISLQNGESVGFGRIEIQLSECRYPTENPSEDAYAFLQIIDGRESEPSFKGWMLASSPALSALEHARYDVWVIRCLTE